MSAISVRHIAVEEIWCSRETEPVGFRFRKLSPERDRNITHFVPDQIQRNVPLPIM